MSDVNDTTQPETHEVPLPKYMHDIFLLYAEASHINMAVERLRFRFTSTAEDVRRQLLKALDGVVQDARIKIDFVQVAFDYVLWDYNIEKGVMVFDDFDWHTLGVKDIDFAAVDTFLGFQFRAQFRPAYVWINAKKYAVESGQNAVYAIRPAPTFSQYAGVGDRRIEVLTFESALMGNSFTEFTDPHLIEKLIWQTRQYVESGKAQRIGGVT